MKTHDVVEWLKIQVETKLKNDLQAQSVRVWLSPDRPNPDVVAECVDKDGNKVMFRFLVV